MVDADVSESRDVRYIVRFVNGVGIPLEYRCASAAEAQTLLEVLGLSDPNAREGARETARPPPPFRVELTSVAREELRGLAEDEWTNVRRAIAEVALQAAHTPPPSRAMLLAAGVQPPALRLREGHHVVVYETDVVDRVLTVLHVLEIG